MAWAPGASSAYRWDELAGQAPQHVRTEHAVEPPAVVGGLGRLPVLLGLQGRLSGLLCFPAGFCGFLGLLGPPVRLYGLLDPPDEDPDGVTDPGQPSPGHDVLGDAAQGGAFPGRLAQPSARPTTNGHDVEAMPVKVSPRAWTLRPIPTNTSTQATSSTLQRARRTRRNLAERGGRLGHGLPDSQPRRLEAAVGSGPTPRRRPLATCRVVRSRPPRRLAATIATCVLALTAASCTRAVSHQASSGGTGGTTSTPAGASRASTTASQSASGAPTSRPPATAAVATTATTAATPVSTVADQLTAWGATEANWDLNHQPDPRVPNHTGFWPRLSNGLDTYASVNFAGGKALRYTENLYPAETSSQARYVVHDELPPSAHLVSAERQSACEELVFASPKLTAMTGGGVRATLHSPGAVFDAADVVSITYRPSTLAAPIPSAPC